MQLGFGGFQIGLGGSDVGFHSTHIGLHARDFSAHRADLFLLFLLQAAFRGSSAPPADSAVRCDQFLLGHAGLAGQGFFLRFRSLHAILQFFDLGLARAQLLGQLLDSRMRDVVGVSERRHHQNRQHHQNPLAGV